jgi:aminoglycoside 6'-N-acetyltransferase
VSEVEAKYGPTIDRGGTTHRFVIKGNGAAIGLIQWYRLRDFPDYAIAIGEDPDRGAGMDLFIGDPNAIGRGIGSEAIRRFADSMVPRSDGMDRVVSGPARDNLRSIRAFEKAGFQHVRDALVPGERVPEAIMVLDRRPAKIR